MKFISNTAIVLFFLFGIVLTMSLGCQFDKIDVLGEPVDTTGNNDTTGTGGEDTFTVSDCDPNVVYFAKDVLPIITSSCAKSGCHDVASHQEGVILTDYASIMNTGDIRPGDPAGSDLYEHITENDEDKIMPPPPNAPLTSAQIAVIRKWIQQGAQNLTCNEGTLCDDSNVTFSGTVAPILNSSCIGCHNPNFVSGGIILSTHAGAAAAANSGRLYGAITHSVGFKPMPQSGNKLNACNIKLIKKWIDNGSPNN